MEEPITGRESLTGREYMADTPIEFSELPALSGKVGRVTLNVPATLNSLTLEMVDLLQEQLDR